MRGACAVERGRSRLVEAWVDKARVGGGLFGLWRAAKLRRGRLGQELDGCVKVWWAVVLDSLTAVQLPWAPVSGGQRACVRVCTRGLSRGSGRCAGTSVGAGMGVTGLLGASVWWRPPWFGTE
ncbi:hypothetical protein FRC12_011431 [Ceratobasidium sp. 428]|nr:hypothetical protein FRC12_011431 [Ceratobasidium sp. 428]